jgi:hypothetical protein
MAAKKPPATPDTGGAVTLEAIEPIRHDGEDVAPGATFAVNAETAAVLLASGAAKKSA